MSFGSNRVGENARREALKGEPLTRFIGLGIGDPPTDLIGLGSRNSPNGFIGLGAGVRCPLK